MAMTDVSWQRRELEVDLGPIAHGGHVVARYDGRVIFVRHGIPGERALVRITEDNGGAFCRGDAIEILAPDADRVSAPCPHARPGGCGGCDFQHVSLPRQRQLKAEVIAEQLRRLAGLTVDVAVLALGDQNAVAGSAVTGTGNAGNAGLGWRRKVRYSTDAAGRVGLKVHRSHAVIEIARCPLATAEVGDATAITRYAEAATELEVAQGSAGEVAVTRYRQSPEQGYAARPHGRQQHGRSRERRSRRGERTVSEHLAGPSALTYQVADRHFSVRATGFWQTHPAAAETFTAAVSYELALRPGERVLDLYAGAGLFTAAIARDVGHSGRVIGLEVSAGAVEDAAANLADLGHAQVRRATVDTETVAALAAELGGVDAVVLDPPRTGAGARLMSTLTAICDRVIVYVACDPAALARDIRAAMDSNWELAGLRAYDAFPMTHHVECIATLRPIQRRSLR
jgi:tRNA/tmRNA/rRNA uracil-C5-methylase (TrmA/RlmC/RlmD family)